MIAHARNRWRTYITVALTGILEGVVYLFRARGFM